MVNGAMSSVRMYGPQGIGWSSTWGGQWEGVGWVPCSLVKASLQLSRGEFESYFELAMP